MRVKVDVPKEGYWQVDLVHPSIAPELTPAVRLGLQKLSLDRRPELDEAELARPMHVTVLGAAYLNKGGRHFTLGGQFFTGFSHLVLTPLPEEHPLTQELGARTSDLQEKVANETPVLRVFGGTRTDDGMDYSTFGEPTLVDAPLGEPTTYTFVERLEHLPVPAPESGDVEILSGILLLGLWNDDLVHDRISTGAPLCIESIELEAPYEPQWPPASRSAIFFDPPGDDARPPGGEPRGRGLRS